MAIIKCKMCGGDIELSPDRTYGICDSCGSTMTFPKIDDEQRANAFNRGNYFRRIGEFDKALAVYERIVEEDETDAEAHWCCALCRFGIEYVEDPATHAYLPTCHRASFDSFLEDVDYLAALQYSDGVTRAQYRQDAEKIAEVQRGILATSQTEAPFDVFICYKETDEDGQRTRDSIMAQEIYYQLTEQSRRVFFARITLEDKAGQQYEPYIFAALNSAKVMIVVGTSARNFNAVWVKNEWSRFLALMKKDKKKLLLPCYRDMDPYDLPEQLSILQAYDMSKIGFLQDLIRGVNKVLDADKEPEPAHETVVVQGEGASNLVALLKRGEMSLEDGEWKAADEFFDRALDMDAECAEAWRGKFLARVGAQSLTQHVEESVKYLQRGEKGVPTRAAMPDPARAEAAVARFTVPGYLLDAPIRALYPLPKPYQAALGYWQEKLEELRQSLNTDRDLRRARSFARGAFKEKLAAEDRACAEALSAALQNARQRDAEAEKTAREAYTQALDEADRKAEALCKEAEAKRDGVYRELCQKQAEAETASAFGNLASAFQRLNGYKDSAARAKQCREQADALQAQKEAEQQRMAREQAKKRKRNAIIAAVIVAIIAIAAAAALYITQVLIPARDYQAAEALYESGQYQEAAQAFEAMGDYEDAPERALQARYAHADALQTAGDYDGALTEFEALGDYNDAPQRIPGVHYAKAEALLAAGDYDGALAEFEAAGDCEDAPERILATHYAKAEALLAAGDNDGAIAEFEAAGSYLNAPERIQVIHYTQAEALLAAGDYDGAITEFGAAGSYEDASERIPATHYVKAEALLAAGNYDGAITEFGAAGEYQDAPGRVLATHYAQAEAMEAAGNLGAAAIRYGQLGDYHGARERSFALWNQVADRDMVSAGGNHTVGLKSDGTVVAVGYNDDGQCDVEDWTDIVAVSVGYSHTVGLKSDGTVVAVGNNIHGQCAVEGWTGIVAVSAGNSHTVGLRSDGTVVAVGNNTYGRCDVKDWTDIVAVSAGSSHTVGLKSDGTVVATEYTGDSEYYYGECDVEGWTDIVATSAGYDHTVGLKSDGTVVAIGQNYIGQCDVEGWTDIVAISAGYNHTVGLKSDGTVVATEYNEEYLYSGQCDVEGWTDIVAISAGYNHTVGLKSDGTVVAVGDNYYGQCDVSAWSDILVRP